MGLWSDVASGGCPVIAEIAQAHDGSLGTAHALLDAVADAGADAVKFQTHLASAESTLDEPWRVRFSRQDETRYDYWRRMEFTPQQWEGLASHAAERGIAFASSPFSVEAVELLRRLGMPFFKIASGEVTNPPLIDAVLAAGLPVVVSTGMSPLEDVDALVARCREAGVDVMVMQCTTEYPAVPEHWGLDQLAELRERYGCPVGFSDHSGTVYAGLAAAALGASAIEVHIALDRRAFGPDVSASLDPDGLADLVRGVRAIAAARASKVTKAELVEGAAALRSVFGRSWAPARPLPAGHVLAAGDVVLKKPGDGIPFAELDGVVGKTLARPVVPERLLRREDLA